MGTTISDTTTMARRTVVVASNPEDASAVQAVLDHHAELAGALRARVDALVATARRQGDGTTARGALVGFCTQELLPHAAAEEATLYPLAAGDARATLLVEGMVAEHRVIQRLVDDLQGTDDAVLAAASATALLELFEVHLAKENDLVLPLVAADPSLSLAGALDGMHEILGGQPHEDAPAGDVHPGDSTGSTGPGHEGCGCGHAHDEDEASPVLDVRAVPHAIRHATVFGAIGAVPRGGALVLVAPHDPLPLLAQIEQREPGAFSVGYDERGPETWRLRLTRVA